MYSTMALIFLSVDRFIFIRQPFRYNTAKAYNRAHVGFMVLGPLLYIIFFSDGVYSEINGGKGNLPWVFAFVFLATVAILFFLNVSVYNTICKQRKAIKTQCKLKLSTRDTTRVTKITVESTYQTPANPTLKNPTPANLTPTSDSEESKRRQAQEAQ